MTELTEREQKLMDYIAYLFGVINIFSTMNSHLFDITTWQHDDLEKIDFTTKIQEIVETCNKEFNWDAKFYKTPQEVVENTKQGD